MKKKKATKVKREFPDIDALRQDAIYNVAVLREARDDETLISVKDSVTRKLDRAQFHVENRGKVLASSVANVNRGLTGRFANHTQNMVNGEHMAIRGVKQQAMHDLKVNSRPAMEVVIALSKVKEYTDALQNMESTKEGLAALEGTKAAQDIHQSGNIDFGTDAEELLGQTSFDTAHANRLVSGFYNKTLGPILETVPDDIKRDFAINPAQAVTVERNTLRDATGLSSAAQKLVPSVGAPTI